MKETDGGDILRSQIRLELDQQNRPKFGTEEEVEAEVGRRQGVVPFSSTKNSEQAAPGEGDDIVDGEFVESETGGGGGETKQTTFPGRMALNRILGMADGQGRRAALERWQSDFADTAADEDWTRATAALGTAPVAAEATNRIEIPKEEKQLRLFLRERIIEIVRITSNFDGLTLDVVRNKLIQGLGFDPKTFTPVNLFPVELANRRETVRDDVESEINTRCLLRAAELKEQSYKAMADKGAAVNRYMNDMKGSESGGASAALLDRAAYLWLKELKDLGDGLTREKVDHAFAVFVMLGENDPDFSEPWIAQFEKYRPKKLNPDGSESWKANYYDPSYDRKMKTQVLVEMETVFGKDAMGLAWQMFQAFGEEGNYNWQHYLSRDYTFAANRHSLATLLTPPVFVGSRRVYETGVGTYKDELDRVALSPLRVKTKVGEDPDPTATDPTKTKERLESGVYLTRARKGAFLSESPFDDQNMVKEGKMPQQLSFATVKDGEKFRAAVAAVGDLGKEADKAGKIGPAIGSLVDLRSFGQSLVEAGVITQDELDKQIETEARNIIWEMSVENPINVQDLAVQVKGKQNFLTPTTINTLFQAIGGRTREGYFLLGSDDVYQKLRDEVLKIRSRSWETFDKLVGDDEALVDKERHANSFIQLPNKRGNPLVDNIGRVNQAMTKMVAGPVSSVMEPLGKILFPEIIFGKRKK